MSGAEEWVGDGAVPGDRHGIAAETGADRKNGTFVHNGRRAAVGVRHRVSQFATGAGRKNGRAGREQVRQGHTPQGVVLPSDVEGQSLAPLDAMGAELGVGASEVAEIKNKDKIDDAADLADRLLFLIANPALRKAAGQAAKRRIRER